MVVHVNTRIPIHCAANITNVVDYTCGCVYDVVYNM